MAVVEKIKLVGSLIKLYLQKAINVLNIVMIHFEEMVAFTEEQVEELSQNLKQVVEAKEMLDNMIVEVKKEIIKGKEE